MMTFAKSSTLQITTLQIKILKFQVPCEVPESDCTVPIGKVMTRVSDIFINLLAATGEAILTLPRKPPKILKAISTHLEKNANQQPSTFSFVK